MNEMRTPSKLYAPETKDVVIVIRVTPTQAAALDAHAELGEVSRSEFVRQALEQWFRQPETASKQAAK